MPNTTNQNFRIVDQGPGRRCQSFKAVFPDADDGKPFFGHAYASGAAASALTAAAARALPPRRPRTVM